MLVLSRKRGEQIVIGNGVTVTVLDIRSGQVRLGFDAPKELPIHRAEVQKKIDGALSDLDYAKCA